MKPLFKSIAYVHQGDCVAYSCCLKACPRQTLDIWKGFHTVVHPDPYMGCGKRSRECPASIIDIIPCQIKTNLSSDDQKGKV